MKRNSIASLVFILFSFAAVGCSCVNAPSWYHEPIIQPLPFCCKPCGFAFKCNTLVLNPGGDCQMDHSIRRKSHLYVIKSKTNNEIWLDHPPSCQASTSGWTSRLGCGRFSAIKIDVHDFVLTCAVRDCGQYLCIPCSKVIEVCRVEDAKFLIGQEGNFWVAENYPRPRLLEVIQLHGFYW